MDAVTRICLCLGLAATRVRLALIIGALLGIGAIQESAAKSVVALYAACHGKYGIACFGYSVAPEGAALREAPRASAPAIETVPRAMEILLLEPFERNGWVRARTQPEDGTDAREAWVQRSDIALAWDFHRVVGCWPVAELAWQEDESGDYGDLTFMVRSDVRGNLDVTVDNTEYDVRHMAAWHAKGIVRIAKLRRTDEALSAWFILDYPQRSVRTILGVYGKVGDPPFRLAPDEKLQGCTTIPVVDPKQPMLKPPRKKN